MRTKFELDTFHQTLRLKRECGEKYNNLRGIGKTTLFWENVTQLIDLSILENKKKVIPIISNNLHPNEFLNSIGVLEDLCQLKELHFNVTKMATSKFCCFSINDVKFLLLTDVKDIRGLGPVLSSDYILYENCSLDIKSRAYLESFNLDEIYFT